MIPILGYLFSDLILNSYILKIKIKYLKLLQFLLLLINFKFSYWKYTTKLRYLKVVNEIVQCVTIMKRVGCDPHVCVKQSFT